MRKNIKFLMYNYVGFCLHKVCTNEYCYVLGILFRFKVNHKNEMISSTKEELLHKQLLQKCLTMKLSLILLFSIPASNG